MLAHVDIIFWLTCLQAERVHVQCCPQCLRKRFCLAESPRVAGGPGGVGHHTVLMISENSAEDFGIILPHGITLLQKIHPFLGWHVSRCWWGSWRNSQMWSPAMSRSAPMARRLCGSDPSKLLRRWMHSGCSMSWTTREMEESAVLLVCMHVELDDISWYIMMIDDMM